jgi:hypothetical protein
MNSGTFSSGAGSYVELLVERADLDREQLDITLKIEGLTSLASQLDTSQTFQQAAE